MYSSILLSVALGRGDLSHASLARDTALALAKGTGASIHVLTVENCDAPAIDHLKPEAGEQLATLIGEQVHHEKERELSEFAAPLISAGVKVETHLLHGNPRDAVLHAVDQLDADVLVIGSHSKRGLLDVMLGSTAHHLSTHAHCPVILVSPEQPKP